MMAWQLIETAPKDRTRVLIFRVVRYNENEDRVVVGFYDPAWKCWMTMPGRYGCKPTHWQPRPNPPDLPDYSLTDPSTMPLEDRE